MLGASDPCSVLKTSTPVSAARMPIRAVSSSRISPIMMMSGSWRSIARSPSLKPISPVFVIWVWLTPGMRCSIGSSIVITFLIGRVDPLQAVVERGSLARANRPGNQHGAVGLGDQLVQRLGLFPGHAQMREPLDIGHYLVDPDDDLLAENRGKRRHSQVARAGDCAES